MTTSLVERLIECLPVVGEFESTWCMVGTHDLREAAAELTRLQAELDAARGALTEVDRIGTLVCQRYATATGLWGSFVEALLSARAAIKETKA